MTAQSATADVATATADVASLLAPISADHPSGESLRYAELFDEIKELRREDDASLPQGVWKRELKRAEWNDVAKLAGEALETQTKDLQLAAWLLEAWVHLHGLPGAERGLRLVRGLCDDFWDDLHPQIEDGDLDFRLAPLRWLDERLPALCKSVPLTDPDGDDAQAYTWADWDAAQHLAGLPDRNAEEEADQEGRCTQSKFLVSVSLTPSAVFARLDGELAALTEAVAGLRASLQEREGETPAFTAARETLETIRAYVARQLEERIDEGDGPISASEVTEPAGLEAEQSVPAPRAGGRIRSRAEAYQRLNEAAEYLMRVEPHSPAPYLVRRAVAWGGLSLAELLAELLSKNADLDTIYELLGIRSIDT